MHRHALAKRGHGFRKPIADLCTQPGDPIQQNLPGRTEQRLDLGIAHPCRQQQWRQPRIMEDLIGIRVPDATEETRVRERPLEGVVLPPQTRGKLLERRDQHLKSSAINVVERRGSPHDSERGTAFRSCFGEEQKAFLELERGERVATRRLSSRRAPTQPASDHQVNHQKEIILKRQHYPLAETIRSGDPASDQGIDRRLDRSHQERARQPQAGQNLSNHEPLERLQIDRYVGKFGQGSEWTGEQTKLGGTLRAVMPFISSRVPPSTPPSSVTLPILEVLPLLRDALRRGPNAVVQAPPGAGKTTMVPLGLLDEPWLEGQRIIMLEPRRLAARAAAHRMATLRGERIGETVGYRIRRDTRVGPRTRIEVVTEGILTRMLNHDPTLEGIGVVLFDEFHERSVHADLGLALTLHTQRLVRPDLRVVVMSATLNGAEVARLLEGAPVIASEGRLFPVEIRYLPPRAGQRLEWATADAIRTALAATAGDMLVFLPGQGEIARVESALHGVGQGFGSVDVLPLYGNLSFEEQDRAIAPSPAGRRKVVLATSIAETSLTIEGIQVIIDAGLSRAPRFSARTGMTQLTTSRVSRASAEQRAGRAGRLAPGVCYRLWRPDEHAYLLPFSTPEILDADLAPLALELLAAGLSSPDELRWPTPPPAGGWKKAIELLTWLEAVGSDGRITGHGRRMSALGAHPRLAHMLLRTRDSDDAVLACDIAALIEERDVLRSDGPEHDADLRPRIELLRASRRGERLPERVGGMRVMHDAVQKAGDGAREWRREMKLGTDREWTDVSAAGRVLGFAFPDRVAQRRPGSQARYRLRNGAGAVLSDSPALGTEPYLVIAETDGKAPEARIYLAAALALDALRADFGGQVTEEDIVEWDETHGVKAIRRESLGALVLRERRSTHPDPDRVRALLVETVARSELALLSWSESGHRLRERLAFIHAHDDSWPDVRDDALIATLETWLGPHLGAVWSITDLSRLDPGEILLAALSWQRRSKLDQLAPTHFTAPSGSRLPIDYSDPAAPAVRVRLQEMFGQTDSPRLMDGRIPLTFHLLSPAQRPVQVTQDLASFWTSSYFDVRKDLKGRYPKHPWPENPLSAEPTRRRKPRGGQG